jgi:uncharacterized repeat protein (TIGR03803 family)
MRKINLCLVRAAVLLTSATLVFTANVSAQSTLKVLHKFAITDGTGPVGGVVLDSKGNIYGATNAGGDTTCNAPSGCGTVFKVTSAGKFSVIHLFRKWGADGRNPGSLLSMDAAGNLYGTTWGGGGAWGEGAAYKIWASGKETVMFRATSTAEWDVPEGIAAAADGNFYGTTLIDGEGGCWFGSSGCGEIYKLSSRWALTKIHAFTGGSDGGEPYAGVIVDAAGNLYGTAHYGGQGTCYGVGCGTVFKVDALGNFSTLKEFEGFDGGLPGSGNLLMDAAGNLYGATNIGGSSTVCYQGCGVVFMMSPQSDGSWSYSVLYNFDGVSALNPNGGLVMDAAGNLYGTAGGGVGGVIFELSPQAGGSWDFSIYHQFLGTPASGPAANLAIDKAGNIYGSSGCGSGQGCYGTVFKVTH